MNANAYKGVTYASVQIRLDVYQDTYSRQVYGIMDLFGDVGGVQTVLVVFGAYLSGIIAERLLNAEMMKQIYHTLQKKRGGGGVPGRKQKYKKAKIEDNHSARNDYTTQIDQENGGTPGRIEVSRRKIIN